MNIVNVLLKIISALYKSGGGVILYLRIIFEILLLNTQPKYFMRKYDAVAPEVRNIA